jgi:hypothetical protein
MLGHHAAQQSLSQTEDANQNGGVHNATRLAWQRGQKSRAWHEMRADTRRYAASILVGGQNARILHVRGRRSGPAVRYSVAEPAYSPAP